MVISLVPFFALSAVTPVVVVSGLGALVQPGRTRVVVASVVVAAVLAAAVGAAVLRAVLASVEVD